MISTYLKGIFPLRSIYLAKMLVSFTYLVTFVLVYTGSMSINTLFAGLWVVFYFLPQTTIIKKKKLMHLISK